MNSAENAAYQHMMALQEKINNHVREKGFSDFETLLQLSRELNRHLNIFLKTGEPSELCPSTLL